MIPETSTIPRHVTADRGEKRYPATLSVLARRTPDMPGDVVTIYVAGTRIEVNAADLIAAINKARGTP